ncbi:MAG: FadR family transcriptional regulator [Gammaproteobacteria bacterium]|jgi:DNA-binding FadR family transcriptional regulator|nr:FadR family transcriptional regulator [Gammaproteobacteria bacterium]MBT3859022.1 FadR family transcriptional regulator [Gammaproteobacteria bacterium]MBT3987867.1 FadR family transcriptional regulator [Gammaproteobacteria bacterium]MBT4257533.1 FadR family transcriptional regulator [Gammaproteobacteria bacterium]MBT4583305.1 FadR family transcriptional regulator [Gammaproteobacteria bacterium]
MSDTNTLSHEICGILRDEILLQRYRSGERFPSERDLASRFDASRGAVREALSQLDQMGLIRSQPGGARIQSIDSASIAILGPLMVLNEFPDAELVDQFLQTFAALTSLSIKGAIEKADEAQLIQMTKMVVEMSRYANDFETMQPRMSLFHELISNITDNLVVRLIGNDLKAQFVEGMMQSGIKPMMNELSLEGFFKKLEISISKKDGAMAADAFDQHFEELRRATKLAIQTREQELSLKTA